MSLFTIAVGIAALFATSVPLGVGCLIVVVGLILLGEKHL
jgi:hypothetical protein